MRSDNETGAVSGQDRRLQEILNNRTIYYFYELSRIPRGSGNEKAVSDYICSWARDLGLYVKQDEVNNLIIKKEASEKARADTPVLLQAHLDMVCDKEPDSNHNFLTDPIPWKIDGDWISSKDGSTLGADCGIGVALIMSILEDKEAIHPPLEVLLTVREETDMEGAYRADKRDFQADRMINLDISPDDKLLAGSCGGEAAELTVPLTYEAVPEENRTVRLVLEGMKGGHSGSDIHRGRGNAILLLSDLLGILKKEAKGLKLLSFGGGNSRLAIPREAEAAVSIPSENLERLEQVCREFESAEAEKYADSPPKLWVRTASATDGQTTLALTDQCFEKVLKLCLLIPNGISKMSPLMEGTVESSSNLGIARMEGEELRFIEEIRSTYPASRERIADAMGALAQIFKGHLEIHSTYPEWRYKKDSALRDTIVKVYNRREAGEMEVFCSHAGNEIGILFQALGLKDAAAMGPSRYFYHSPKEKQSISSAIRFEGFLREVLAELAE